MNNSLNGGWRQKVSPSSTHESGIDDALATVVLVRGEDPEGTPLWAYALIPAEQFMAFRMAEAQGAYDLADYGTVLHHGSGAEPPAEIQKEMADTYGCVPGFEQELETLLSEALEELPGWEETPPYSG